MLFSSSNCILLARQNIKTVNMDEEIHRPFGKATYKTRYFWWPVGASMQDQGTVYVRHARKHSPLRKQRALGVSLAL